ncbi:hypothetical protein ACI1US_02378 [Leucobacter sp. BZR 635]
MAMYTGTISAQGGHQSRVTCSHCGGAFYIDPHFAKAGGRWNCPHCKREN